MKRAVFLDRDGVLNRTILIGGVPKPPVTIGEVEILEGVVEATKTLKDFGFVLVVVSNQPDVARGIVSESDVNDINEFIGSQAKIDYFYTCFHDDLDLCDCRKPLPGLIKRASIELGLDIEKSYLVGDRWRDIEAGQAVGCKTFFIDYSYPEREPVLPYIKVSSLLEAVDFMIGE